MRGNEFLDKMALVDPAYVEAADAQPKKKSRAWVRWAAAAACLCLLAAAAAVLPRMIKGKTGEQEVFHLSERTTAKVYPGCEGAENSTGEKSYELVGYTEEEMFAMDDLLIFRGKVTGLQNVTVVFNTYKEYLCIATVEVSRVYKGGIEPGEPIKMLLPCPIDSDDTLWIEDTDVISQLRVGMEGIFMPREYKEDSVWEEDGVALRVLDLAPCGLGDGMRWAFFGNGGWVTFARFAYPGARRAHSLDEIEEYVLNMLGE